MTSGKIDGLFTDNESRKAKAAVDTALNEAEKAVAADGG